MKKKVTKKTVARKNERAIRLGVKAHARAGVLARKKGITMKDLVTKLIMGA